MFCKLRILVSGYVIRRPLGGLAWHYLNYVLGLHRLGHDVYYIEDSEDQPACFDPTKLPERIALSGDQRRSPHEYIQRDPSYGLAFASKVFSQLGVPDKWAYYEASEARWRGPNAGKMADICASADLLINVSNSIALRPFLQNIPARALIDTDPVFGQLRHKHLPVWRKRALQHTSFMTFGENYGRNSCSIPSDGLPWKSTRQPLVLDLWPSCPPNPGGAFTTVLSWDSYPPGKDRDNEYGLKSDSFLPYMDFPTVDELPILEMAIECSPRVWTKLKDRGWNLQDAIKVTSDPWKYRKYIQSSAAEFTVAKQGYVSTRSGWFSERSAAYLATGRPVVTQDTGFGDWMDCDSGVIPFSSAEEAINGLREVVNNYESHARAARAIAEEYFDSDTVLSTLISNAMNADTAMQAESGGRTQEVYDRFVVAVEEHVGGDESLVLIDDQQLGIAGVAAGRACLPFLEKDGLYWGNPVDDTQAIFEIERLRAEGARYLFIVEPAFWWLEYYENFIQHLDSKFHRRLQSGELIMFDLGKSAR